MTTCSGCTPTNCTCTYVRKQAPMPVDMIDVPVCKTPNLLDAMTAHAASGGGKLTGEHYYRVAVPSPISPELQPYTAECADIIEALGMTFNEGEAFKALWRLAAARQGRGKPGNKAQYDADKVAHYGQRVAAHTRAQEKRNG